MSYDRSKDPRADKVTYRALAAPTPKRPLTVTERNARRFNWLSYSAVIRGKGTERVLTVQATDDADARYRLGLRLAKGEKVWQLTLNGEAY